LIIAFKNMSDEGNDNGDEDFEDFETSGIFGGESLGGESLKSSPNFRTAFQDSVKMTAKHIRTDTDIHYAVRLWCYNQPEADQRFGHISKWDTSSVTNINRLFLSLKRFNEDISQWDVGQVTNMWDTFKGASSFNQPLSTWNVGQVANMQGTFLGASSFNQPLSTWNVGQVTNMRSMFKGASSFNQPLSTWDVRQVTSMWNMFKGASSFNQPLSTWNVGQVTNMRGTFYGASSFNQPLSEWNVGQVTNMRGMFSGASSFNQPLSTWNVGHVTNMGAMFRGASSFNQPLPPWYVGTGMRGWLSRVVRLGSSLVPSLRSDSFAVALSDDHVLKALVKDFVADLFDEDDDDSLGIRSPLLMYVESGRAYSYFEEGLLVYLMASKKIDADDYTRVRRLLMSLRHGLGITDASDVLTDASVRRLEDTLAHIPRAMGRRSVVNDLNHIHEYVTRRALETARQSREVSWMRSRLYFLGDGGAGKTSLFRALTGQAAVHEHQSTIGGVHEEVRMQQQQPQHQPQQQLTLEDMGLAVERSSRLTWQKRGIGATTAGEVQRAHQIECKRQLALVMQQEASSTSTAAASGEDDSDGMHPSPAVVADINSGSESSGGIDGDVPVTSPAPTEAPTEEGSRPPLPSTPLPDAAAETMPQVQDLGTLRIAHSTEQSRPSTVTAGNVLTASHPLGVDDDDDPSILFSVWDFGGQRAFQSFQHVFFSRYGVYVVVFDLSLSRDDNGGGHANMGAIVEAVLAWIDMIDVYANGAPWVLVGTHKDDPCCTMEHLRAVSSDLTARLKKDYKGLWDRLVQYVVAEDADKKPMEMFCYWPVYCLHSDGSNIQQLGQVLHQAAWDDPEMYVHERVPTAYLRIYDRIVTMAREQHYLRVSDAALQDGEVSVAMLCREEGFLSDNETPAEQQAKVDALVRYYDRLGLCLHFKEASLADVLVINPQWLVNSVSRVAFLWDCWR
jgi:surface protein